MGEWVKSAATEDPFNLFTCSPIHLLTCSPAHLFTFSPVHLFPHSPIHPFPHSRFTFHVFTFHVFTLNSPFTPRPPPRRVSPWKSYHWARARSRLRRASGLFRQPDRKS